MDESSLALVVAGLYRREVGLEHRLQSSPMGLDVLVGQLVVTLLEVDQGADAPHAVRVEGLQRRDETVVPQSVEDTIRQASQVCHHVAQIYVCR